MAVNMLACETKRDCLPHQYLLIVNYNMTVKITATARTWNVYWKYSVLATFQCESLLLLENNKYFNNNLTINDLTTGSAWIEAKRQDAPDLPACGDEG